MPAHYAYYRFGTRVLSTLPPELSRTVRRFRQLYDMGLHGPDLFRYPAPLHIAAAVGVQKKFRGQSGKAFFERAGRMIRLHPTEGAVAYLCGLLAHYALRTATTAYLCRQPGLQPAKETEFDRYLLELDGKGPAHLYDRSGHIRLTPGECGTVAAFYPPASSGLVRSCTKVMADQTRFLALPEGLRRNLLNKAMAAAGPKAAGLLMPVHAAPEAETWGPELLKLSDAAEAQYAVLVEQIQAYLRRGTPLGPDFSENFL